VLALGQRAAVDGAGFQVERGDGVDPVQQAVQPAGGRRASGSRRISAKPSIRSPKAVPWAQPLVSVFFVSFSSKSVRAGVRTTTTPRSSSYCTSSIASAARSMPWLSR
jgi:hypothetical protein